MTWSLRLLILPLITFSVLLIGRLSPGPAAVPYRHNDAQQVQAIAALPTAIVTLGAPPAALAAQTAFSKPLDLRWDADWTREVANKAAQVMGLHAQNSPVRFIRDVPWNMDLAPTLLRGGGAALIVKVVY